MPVESPEIFRREAMWHLLHGQEKSVLPRFIRPRTFLCLWILLGLLLLAGVLAWAARVPINASGIAVVTEFEGKVSLDILVPAETVEKLSFGQTVWIRWPGAREPVRTRLTLVESGIHSPAEVRQRFGLTSEAVAGAVIIAMADPEGVLPATRDLPAEIHLGSTVPVEVEIGSRRALSLLPFVGEMFR